MSQFEGCTDCSNPTPFKPVSFGSIPLCRNCWEVRKGVPEFMEELPNLTDAEATAKFREMMENK